MRGVDTRTFPPPGALTQSRTVVPDAEMLARLRTKDSAAFTALVRLLHGRLLRLARLFVRDAAVAEEVVQDTWVAVLNGLDGFEGRSALRTWIIRILVNKAKTRAVREARSVPVSSLPEEEAAAVDPERFTARGGWAQPPQPWEERNPEQHALEVEALACVETTLRELPELQRAVVFLRDVEGLDAEEACNVLSLSESNQRVLLHRARSRLRAALERHHTRR